MQLYLDGPQKSFYTFFYVHDKNSLKLKTNLLIPPMDYLKNNDNYEISLIFTNNAYITLSTEIIEVTLDDQNKID